MIWLPEVRLLHLFPLRPVVRGLGFLLLTAGAGLALAGSASLAGAVAAFSSVWDGIDSVFCGLEMLTVPGRSFARSSSLIQDPI